VIPLISRRDALRALPGIVAASKLFAHSKRQLPVKTLSHVTLRVSDPKRSIEFYQGLFGLPVQAYQGPDRNALPTLRIGAGPQFLFVYGNEKTGGAREGAPEMYIGDPDGLTVQLQDTSYCGGAGRMGEVCLSKPVPAPRAGLLALACLPFIVFATRPPPPPQSAPNPACRYERKSSAPAPRKPTATPAQPHLPAR
jgi:catechol 2,3-dioxygenase-like lactoylglutathione lyase family enzyme